MDAIDAILTRRSVRRFLTDPVPEDKVKLLLRAAMQAPSAVNQQPWQFVVINDQALLREVAIFHTSVQVLHEAPLGILICGDKRLEKRQNCWFQDCSAATENMLLAAHALGLGACWLGIFHLTERVEGVRRVFDLPPEIMPLTLIALGFPGETPPPEDRYLAERVHYNTWK
jgi:nitroreductase